MAHWLDRLFKRKKTPVYELPILIDVNMDEQGNHLVRIFKVNESGTGNEAMSDVRPMLSYGYYQTSEDGISIYRISEENQQKLLALKSLNPEIREDGTLVFRMRPSILKYMRQRPKDVRESEAAKELSVSDETLRPTARLDYNPQTGITVRTGYTSPALPGMIRSDTLPPVDDGYVRLGKSFVPVENHLSPQGETLLRQPTRFVPLNGIPEFFQRDMVLIHSEFQAVLTDEAKQIRLIRQAARPVVHVERTERGWLDFHITYEAEGVGISHERASSVDRDSYVQADDYNWVFIRKNTLQGAARQLNELGAIPTPTGYRIPIERFASLEEFIESIGGSSEVGKVYQAFLDELHGFVPDPHYRLPDHIERQLIDQDIDLRSYQRAGIHWLHWLYSSHLHGLLADDMGLGKTIQAICALRLAYERSGSQQHSLIIVPRSVLVHWQRELWRCFPEIPTRIYHGPSRDRMMLRRRGPVILISTYDTVARDVEALAEVPFFYLILDEATFIKNHQTRRSQAAKALNAAHRLSLSGTPVENRPAELWSLFDFLMRGHLGRYSTFMTLFETPILQGDRAAEERLGHRIKPFMQRRLKSEVKEQLPPKIPILEYCELTSEQARLYADLQSQAKAVTTALRRQEYVNYTSSILPVLTKLKQVCDHPSLVAPGNNALFGRSHKFDWVIAKIRELYTQSEQVVVFSQYLGMLDLLGRALSKRGIGYVRIDGSTRDRQGIIDQYTDRHIPVALCSLGATSHGINLTSANHVIHVDRWWNPAIEDQATDRVHRIGQDKNVYVHYITVENTLEEIIAEKLERKRETARRIIQAADSGFEGWTREELLRVLEPLLER